MKSYVIFLLFIIFNIHAMDTRQELLNRVKQINAAITLYRLNPNNQNQSYPQYLTKEHKKISHQLQEYDLKDAMGTNQIRCDLRQNVIIARNHRRGKNYSITTTVTKYRNTGILWSNTILTNHITQRSISLNSDNPNIVQRLKQIITHYEATIEQMSFPIFSE